MTVQFNLNVLTVKFYLNVWKPFWKWVCIFNKETTSQKMKMEIGFEYDSPFSTQKEFF